MDELFDRRRLRHYVYVSESKVDSLWNQRPRKKRKFKFTLGAGPAKIESDSSEAELSLEERLADVVVALVESERMGTTQFPGDYIHGWGDLRWGPFHDVYSADETGMVFFGGEVDGVVLGMAGSAHHVTGSHGSNPTHSHSATPNILRALEGVVDLTASAVETSRIGYLPHTPDAVLEAMMTAVKQFSGPSESLEYCARVLQRGTAFGRPCILATPLFVALA